MSQMLPIAKSSLPSTAKDVQQATKLPHILPQQDHTHHAVSTRSSDVPLGAETYRSGQGGACDRCRTTNSFCEKKNRASKCVSCASDRQECTFKVAPVSESWKRKAENMMLDSKTHDSPIQKHRKQSNPSSIEAPPTVRDHTTDQLNPERDEFLPREIDEAGESKITHNGHPANGRGYRMRTFLVPYRGKKLFMLATECARVLGYQDFYLLFHKNRSLYKIIATQVEKDDLVHKGIIPRACRLEEFAIVTARSIFRQFGSRAIVNGQRVRDDYWENKARKQGFTEEDSAGEKRPDAATLREAAAAEAVHVNAVLSQSSAYNTSNQSYVLVLKPGSTSDPRPHSYYTDVQQPGQGLTGKLYQNITAPPPTPSGDYDRSKRFKQINSSDLLFRDLPQSSRHFTQPQHVAGISQGLEQHRKSPESLLTGIWEDTHAPPERLKDTMQAVSAPRPDPFLPYIPDPVGEADEGDDERSSNSSVVPTYASENRQANMSNPPIYRNSTLQMPGISRITIGVQPAASLHSKSSLTGDIRVVSGLLRVPCALQTLQEVHLVLHKTSFRVLLLLSAIPSSKKPVLGNGPNALFCTNLQNQSSWSS